MEINTLGISELRWACTGRIESEQHTVIYSGGGKHDRGVEIIFNKEVAKIVKGFWDISDRVQLKKKDL